MNEIEYRRVEKLEQYKPNFQLAKHNQSIINYLKKSIVRTPTLKELNNELMRIRKEHL